MSDKSEKLMKALENLGILYPKLDKIMIDNLENPNYIIICTPEHFKRVQEELDIPESLSEKLEEHYPSMKKKNKKMH
jgi:hypothetical protein